MNATTELATITGAEAYAKAVELAKQAEDLAADFSNLNRDKAKALAAVSQAYAQIAQAERIANATAPAGCYPDGGWRQHTHPND
ncbi:hypothetical protein [Streptomyces sp. NPDC001658]